MKIFQRALTVLIILVTTQAIFAQDNTITLNRGNRTKIITKKHITYFYQIPKIIGKDSIRLYYGGNLVKVTADSIFLKPIYSGLHTYHPDKRELNAKNYFLNDTITIVALKISDLDQITVHSKSAENLTNTGFLAAFTLLVVAPLVSINYKNGTFDTNRYAKVGGISTAIMIPCFVVGLNFDFRTFNIKSGKKKWTIIN